MNSIYQIVLQPGLFLILVSFLYGFMHKLVARTTAILGTIVAYGMLYAGTYQVGQDYPFLICALFLIVLLVGILFAISLDEDSNIRAALFYAGSALTITLTQNLVVIFIFFELMAVAAAFLILNDKSESSKDLSLEYFRIHMCAGMLFLIGIIMHYIENDSLELIRYDLSVQRLGQISILISLLISIGTPPFSRWLVKGYAAASASGRVFLSAYTTKVALILMMQMFMGNVCLIYIGLIVSIYGVCMASVQSHIIRIINLGLLSQFGLVLIAIGVGSDAGREAAILMLAGSLMYTALLMMCTEYIVFNTQNYDYDTEHFVSNRLVWVCGLIGCASICALPMTVGYLGKYFFDQALSNITWLKHSITVLSVFITLVFGIRFFVFAFSLSNKSKQSKQLRLCAALALLVNTVCCIGLGVLPGKILNVHISLANKLVPHKLLIFSIATTAFFFTRHWMYFLPSRTWHKMRWNFSIPNKVLGIVYCIPPKLVCLWSVLVNQVSTTTKLICADTVFMRKLIIVLFIMLLVLFAQSNFV